MNKEGIFFALGAIAALYLYEQYHNGSNSDFPNSVPFGIYGVGGAALAGYFAGPGIVKLFV